MKVIVMLVSVVVLNVVVEDVLDVEVSVSVEVVLVALHVSAGSCSWSNDSPKRTSGGSMG